MKRHIIWLTKYISSKLSRTDSQEPLKIKRIHTFKVYANARKIALDELSHPRLIRSALLASLYHDIARFDQYLTYGTFKDAQSFNHGLMGARIVKREKILKEEDARTASLALAGIAAHNRRAVPSKLDYEARLVTNIVRDADKIDILRVMDEHLKIKPYNPTVVLGLPDNPELCNPVVIETALKGQCAGYGDLRTVDDFRVLLGSWYFCMNFESSRRLFLNRNHARNLVEGLPMVGPYAEIRKYLLDLYARSKT